MTEEPDSQNKKPLRQRAEAQLPKNLTEKDQVNEANDLLNLVRELRIHQIELELQNEELRNAQEHLLTAKARYFNLYNHAPVGYLTLNHKKMIQDCNITLAMLFGTTPTSLIKEPVSKIIPKKEQILFYKQLKKCNSSEDSIDWETRLSLPGEEPIWVQLQARRAQNDEIWITVSDISRLKTVERELLGSKRQAEEANRAKSVFLSRMSHELRTPLNAIIGFSDLLHTRVEPKALDELESAPALIHSAGHHLLQLVNDVLDIVSIEQGKMIIEMKPVRLDQAIVRAINLCSNDPKPSGTVIKVENIPFYVTADPLRLVQVLTNLISNAIKYNKENGSVTITATENTSGWIEVCVTDTGIGIPVNEESRLFQPFNRLSQALNSTVSGAGVGLSLTKFLLMEMDGSIDFESTEGKGTRFFFTLKKDRPENAKSRVVKRFSGTPQNLKKCIILYVDDDPASRDLMRIVCASRVNTILLTCKTAEASITLAKSTLFNLIILDIDLPGKNGISALKILKTMPLQQDAQIIALSANALPEQIEEAMNAGFDRYITKPFDVGTIDTIAGEL